MLLTFLIESLLRDQIMSFVLTVIMVLVIMVLAYHSFRIGLVSLVPNIFPILLVDRHDGLAQSCRSTWERR